MPESKIEFTPVPDGGYDLSELGLDANGWPLEDDTIQLEAGGDMVLPEVAGLDQATQDSEAAWADPEVVAKIVELAVEDQSTGEHDIHVDAA